MKYHPYSEIWPLLQGEDFNKFKADIAAHGLRDPILTYQDMILDGRNRERACLEMGVTPRYEKAPVESELAALEFVVSKNEHRRHLTTIERAFVAARLSNILHGHNRYQDRFRKVESSNGDSTFKQITPRQVAARRMKVSPTTFDRAKAILTHGTKQDEDDVVSGRIPLMTKSTALLTKRRGVAPKSRVGRPPRKVVPTIVNIPRRAPLTPQEVDPEFKGTPVEFTDKYGHVQVMTAEQYATARFNAWASNMRAISKRAREFPDWPKVDHNWLRSPHPYDIAKLTEALEHLRPLFAEAELLLQRAVDAKLKQTE
jgi:hypothetical protein